MPKIENDYDIAIAELAIALEQDDDGRVRQAFADALDEARPGWRTEQPVIDRVKQIGVREAAVALVKRHEA